jgi:hypothetical protein|tara:strand:- start:120 stop:881 length:762 start_codon:yes stop_codon:yes gene_type:complete
MDEFYKYPDLVVEEIKSLTAATFKIRQIEIDDESYNDKFFRDHRGDGLYRGLYRLTWDLAKLVKQPPTTVDAMEEFKMGNLFTNHCTIYRHPFNEMENSYWYPHIDSGWNGIVYLNKNDSGNNGTNIYSIRRNKRKIIDRTMNNHEHHYPWIPKSQIDRIAYIPSKFNSFAFYNGVKYFHGMHIGDDQYVCDMGEELEEERINQVFFFANQFAINRNSFASAIFYRHSGPVGKVADFIRKILKMVAWRIHSGV